MKNKHKVFHDFYYSKFRSLINHFKNKSETDYHIEVIFAQIGSGKSTDIARRCYKELYTSKGQYSNVYTNIETCIPRVRTFDPKELAGGEYYFPPDSLILIDEVGILYSNRKWKSFPDSLSAYLRKCRHYKNTFIFYSQHYDCEKTIRDLASKLWLMRRFGSFSVFRRISKTIKVRDNEDEHGNADSQVSDSLKFDSIFTGLKITFIPFWTSLFDSFENSSNLKSEIPYKSFKK